MLAGLHGTGIPVVTAQSARTAYLSMMFHAESRSIRTSACLEVTRRAYSESPWWEGFRGEVGTPEYGFAAVIRAIKAKDRMALLKLSDLKQGQDAARFDEQATAFFQQFEVIQLVRATSAYEFDGLVVFRCQFAGRHGTFFAPLLFVHQDDGSFGFLPYRTERTTYLLVQESLNASQKEGGETPAYCSDDEIKRATHRVALDISSRGPNETWPSSYLLLAGAALGKPGPREGVARRVELTVAQMKAAMTVGKLDAFLGHVTSEGGNRLKEWFAAASEVERDRYVRAMRDQEPFFLFDESPLVVVYTRTPTENVQVMYFTVDGSKELLWANSSHITLADHVFKSGALYDGALQSEAFSSTALH